MSKNFAYFMKPISLMYVVKQNKQKFVYQSRTETVTVAATVYI